jgi:diguanylate cyclase (GGDEF)-like protein/PAS domain S-box-containing protein
MNAPARRLLMVEDTMAEAELIRHMLVGPHGGAFEVDHVQRAGTALERLAIHRYDAMLLDLNLPDSRGLEGFERLRAQGAQLPIIILTNERDEAMAARAVREGAQDYLIKREVTPALLERAIRFAIERYRGEEEVRASEKRYDLAAAGANDGLWDWDLRRKTVYYSPRWRAMVGIDGEAVVAPDIETWLGRVHPEDLPGLKSAISAHLQGKVPHLEHEHRIRLADGNDQWMLVRGLAVRDERGNAYRIAGSLTDISPHKRAEEQLLHDALHDTLTRLPNRALFLDRLHHAIRQYRRDSSRQFAVLFFDLDRFKRVNDTLGHTVGDELLVATARRLERFLRPGDTVARLGGDEFGILINGIESAADAVQVAGRVQDLLAEAFVIREHEIYTSASIGVALSGPDYARPEDMLRDADLAMYRAKQARDGRCQVFDSQMHESAMARLRLEADLRRGVERQEFVIHYQPIVDLESGRILGFEALLRWQHPEWGLTYPDRFMRVAEETGLVVPIGWWVMEEACRRTARWQSLFPLDPPLSISVNFSGKLFGQVDLAERITAILAASGLPAASLRLEVTESGVMDYGESVLASLGGLRDMGVQLHIDDFGTGYSSLTYLQRFSYDTLKIDRSFVSTMERSDESSAIVRAIVGLGEMLGMRVIAEGVENAGQIDLLRGMGCPQAQGFWFSEPVDCTGVQALLARSG